MTIVILRRPRSKLAISRYMWRMAQFLIEVSLSFVKQLPCNYSAALVASLWIKLVGVTKFILPVQTLLDRKLRSACAISAA
ncbi:MAG TPA: hypothetical protein VGF97_11750 [Rhizomicrobium sp.]|jgi:hypothetical protein